MQYKFFLPLLIHAITYGMEPLQFESFSPPAPQPFDVVRAEEETVAGEPAIDSYALAHAIIAHQVQQAAAVQTAQRSVQLAPSAPLAFKREPIVKPPAVSALTKKLSPPLESLSAHK